MPGEQLFLFSRSGREFESDAPTFCALSLCPARSAQDVKVGENIGIIVEDEADIAAFKDYVGGAAPAAAAPAPAAATPAPAAAAAPAPAAAAAPPPPPIAAAPAGASAPASPYAKALAAQQGVSLAGMVGTGPGGRIIAADVLEAKDKPAAAAATSSPAAAAASTPIDPGVPFVDVPNSNIKKVTAKRMVESKNTAPHYYLTMEVEMDALMKMRGEVNAAQDVKTSVNDYVIKAAALALKEVPACNTSWTDDYVRQFTAADISVAVNTERGLITPIVFNADSKKITDISNDVKTLAGKAKDGKLKPEEFMGGTFTVSNLGAFGIKQFTAIINMPQACILAVGGAEKKVVPLPDGGFGVKSVMLVSLTSDHRVVDGAIGAEWLKAFKKQIENPLLLLL